MTYSAEISRAHPGCLIFLVDQSSSMDDPIGTAPGDDTPGKALPRKADVVADSLNRLLFELSVRCAKEEGVRDYFHIAVVGYGELVQPALSGALAGRELVPLSEIVTYPARFEARVKKVPDGAGGVVDRTMELPVWVEPVASGGTPMCQALGYAGKLVQGWVDTHGDGFPPIVLNLTDGESTDGNPSEAATRLRFHVTGDGEALLFNLHISANRTAPITFPGPNDALPDKYAHLLSTMSSELPPGMRAYATEQGQDVTDGARGFVFNADMSAVVQFLDIGTRAADIR
ncbi:vWA domain-containing protein [Yinghuangia seranimata]|uniref:vWA domain-containing protein n=1 Tax=Yinghuangia seranimata TaxID=408067 RepID=UPI00248C213C|nr:vWA domain-containing protein [Yinghuangia seranimata]MDI2132151.1 VWA domain-containing protein [Yinghuangia seranimata]